MVSPADERLRQIFCAVFNLPPGSNVAGMKQGEHPAWDSLAHVLLVTAIESEFGVNLETRMQLQMTSYESTLDMLRALGA